MLFIDIIQEKLQKIEKPALCEKCRRQHNLRKWVIQQEMTHIRRTITKLSGFVCLLDTKYMSKYEVHISNQKKVRPITIFPPFTSNFWKLPLKSAKMTENHYISSHNSKTTNATVIKLSQWLYLLSILLLKTEN